MRHTLHVWNHVGKTEMLSTSEDSCSGFRGIAINKPLTGPHNQKNNAQWFFETHAPNTPERLRKFSMTGRQLDAFNTFEDMRVAFE